MLGNAAAAAATFSAFAVAVASEPEADCDWLRISCAASAFVKEAAAGSTLCAFAVPVDSEPAASRDGQTLNHRCAAVQPLILPLRSPLSPLFVEVLLPWHPTPKFAETG